MGLSQSTVGEYPKLLENHRIGNVFSGQQLFWGNASYFPGLTLTLLHLWMSVTQRGCWSDWSFHHSQHCVGTNEIRGRCRHFSDSENVADTETSYGADRGETSVSFPLLFQHVHFNPLLRQCTFQGVLLAVVLI